MNEARRIPAGDQTTRLLAVNPVHAARVLQAIDEREVVAFLQELIRVPSINPPGDVREAIDLCEKKLATTGFQTVVGGATPEKVNLVGTLPGHGGGQRLAFNAHVDVVPIGEPAAWSHPPFGGDVMDGRIYGRGAGDDKASVAAQIMAGVALARSGVSLAGTLLVTTVADEETSGNLGSGYIAREGYVDAHWVIVGEQTMNQICVAERGAIGIQVVVHGVAGHAAAPWEGTNAIEGMSRVIAALQTELWPALAQRVHSYLGHPTATISLITGGVKSNVIPDRCEIHIDRRVLPGETPTMVATEIQTVAERAIAVIPELRVEVVVTTSRPARESDPDSPVVQALQAATRFLGREPVVTGFFAGTDARHFATAARPVFIAGPGQSSTAHQPDEWVGVDEVLEATRLYAVTALILLANRHQQTQE